ncbi:MAG TPA: hypothetical protein PKE03_06225 [Bacteroidales bacterium]|nr:hypothetical protein [Bacteroidales bacterium]
MAVNVNPDQISEPFAQPFGKAEQKAMAAAFVQKPDLISALFDALRSAPPRMAARMAWVVDEISCIGPELMDEHKNDIIALVINSDQQAVLRNLLKVMLLFSTSEAEATALFDRCMHLAANPINEITVRCNALSLAYHIALQYPGLEQEVYALAESLRHSNSAGLRSRIDKLLQVKCLNSNEVMIA